jgi:hypothetical protein
MGAHNQSAKMKEGAFTLPFKAFFVPGKGYCFGAGTSTPSDTVWAKGALFLKIDGAADANVYINEASAGYGTSPSWVAIATP